MYNGEAQALVSNVLTQSTGLVLFYNNESVSLARLLELNVLDLIKQPGSLRINDSIFQLPHHHPEAVILQLLTYVFQTLNTTLALQAYSIKVSLIEQAFMSIANLPNPGNLTINQARIFTMLQSISENVGLMKEHDLSIVHIDFIIMTLFALEDTTRKDAHSRRGLYDIEKQVSEAIMACYGRDQARTLRFTPVVQQLGKLAAEYMLLTKETNFRFIPAFDSIAFSGVPAIGNLLSCFKAIVDRKTESCSLM